MRTTSAGALGRRQLVDDRPAPAASSRAGRTRSARAAHVDLDRVTRTPPSMTTLSAQSRLDDRRTQWTSSVRLRGEHLEVVDAVAACSAPHEAVAARRRRGRRGRSSRPRPRRNVLDAALLRAHEPVDDRHRRASPSPLVDRRRPRPGSASPSHCWSEPWTSNWVAVASSSAVRVEHELHQAAAERRAG